MLFLLFGGICEARNQMSSLMKAIISLSCCLLFLLRSTYAVDIELGDGSDGQTEFRSFTNNKGQSIVAAPLKLKIPEIWDDSELELLLKNNKKVWIKIATLSEKDKNFLIRWGASSKITTGVRLRCKTVSRGTKTSKLWSTSYGSFDKRIISSGALSITAENLRRATRVVEIEWFFLAKSASGKGDPFLFDGGRKEIRIDPLDSFSFKTEVASTSSSDINYAALRKRYISGSQYFGWLAITRNDGEITSIEASQAPIRRLYSEDNGWSDMVKLK